MNKPIAIFGVLAVSALMAGCASNPGDSVTKPGNSTSTATPASIPVAERTAACRAAADGKAGQWSQAQTEWLAAQNAAGDDLQGNLAFLNLNLDSAALAIDTVSFSGAVPTPKPSDLAAYQRDLAALPAVVLAGC